MPPRIAMVVDPWSHPFNGTVVSARRFVFALEEQGFNFRLLAIGTDSRVEVAPFERLSIPGFNRIIDTMRAPLARPSRSRLRKALEGCDLLHVQFPFFLGYMAIREAKRRAIPVVCSFHVQPENILLNLGLSSRWLRRMIYKLFAALFYNRADLVVAPSEFAAELLRKQGVHRPIHVISNGVPERFFELDQARVEPERKLQLLSVGRLAPEKQHETVLRAVAQCSHRADVEVTLAGTGPREAELQALAQSLGIAAHIGPVSDAQLLDLYGESDLFVHSGTVELEGMSVLEAMAAGRTVIVSDSPDSACARFVLEQRERFRVGEPADLAAKIDYWLSHPAERARQAVENRRYASTLSHQRSVQLMASLYNEILKLPAWQPRVDRIVNGSGDH